LVELTHRLLAGNSWMAEYGDPDVPADWAVISQYSPYQQLAAGKRYPPAFFYTSTQDDRVHPAHARKMRAQMNALGYASYYLLYLSNCWQILSYWVHR